MCDTDRRLIERAATQLFFAIVQGDPGRPFGSAVGAAEFIINTTDAWLRGDDVKPPDIKTLSLCVVFFRAVRKVEPPPRWWVEGGEAKAIATLEAFVVKSKQAEEK